MAGGPDPGGSYTQPVALVFIFNLIVGAGALTIPAAFSKAGLYLGTGLVLFLSFISFVCSTFVLEAMACSNAVLLEESEAVIEDDGGKQAAVAAVVALIDDDGTASSPGARDVRTESAGSLTKRADRAAVVPTDDADDDSERLESDPLIIDKLKKDGSSAVLGQVVEGSRYELRTKVEMTVMAEQFLGHRGVVLFYWCIIAYLYGDLVIYAVAVPKSLREMICARPPTKHTDDPTPWPCLGAHDSDNVYHACCVFFALTFAPWVFFNVTQTKMLQIVTTIMRYMAFSFVIIVAVQGIRNGEVAPKPPILADFGHLPTLFGVTIYSFMCHHSIPSLVTPITNKRNLSRLFGICFAVIVCLYLLMGYTATIRFGPDEIQDIYTLNFTTYRVRAVALFLSVFPVLTMSSIFPIISITLRENLKAMLHQKVSRLVSTHGGGERAQRIAVNVGFPLLTVVPPVFVSFFTQDVAMLVGITGSYAGMAIQWLFPAWIVWSARASWRAKDESYDTANYQVSPFTSSVWIYLIFAWSGICFCFTTYVHVMEAMGTPVTTGGGGE